MRALRVVQAVEALSVALWIGGLVTLGAVVAPVVFGTVPAPYSSDAMTEVFQRFDRIAMTCSVVALACEVVTAKLKRTLELTDFARVGFLVLMSGLAVLEGAVFSPEIASLHARGALRGSGELGIRLETVHVRAEAVTKAQFALGVAFFGLLVAPSPSSSVVSTRDDAPAKKPEEDTSEAYEEKKSDPG